MQAGSAARPGGRRATPPLALPLRRRRKGRRAGRLGDREPDPHPRGAMTGHRAEDEERAGLPWHEPHIAALPGREPLVQAAGRSVLERRRHGTGRNRRPDRDDLDRMWQVRVLALEMERNGPALRHREYEAAPAEPVEVHSTIVVRKTRHELEVDGLTRGIRTQPRWIYLATCGGLGRRSTHPPEQHRQAGQPSHVNRLSLKTTLAASTAATSGCTACCCRSPGARTHRKCSSCR